MSSKRAGGQPATGSKRSTGAAGAAAAASPAAAAAAAGNSARSAAKPSPPPPQAEQYYFEEVEVPSIDDDDDDPSAYPEVPVDGALGEGDEDDGEETDGVPAALEDEDYASLVQSLHNTHTTLPVISGAQGAAKSPSSASRPSPESLATPADLWLQRKLKVWKLVKTAEMFAAEWADLRDAGQLPTAAQIGVVPSERVAARAEAGEAKIGALERELSATGAVAHAARDSWEKLRRERDYHRMHHQRVLQEKEALVRDLKRLKKHYHSFEPALHAMQQKYEQATKEKMMMRLERDKVKAKNEELEEHIKVLEQAQGAGLPAQESKEDDASAAASASMTKKLSATGGAGGEKKRLKNGAHPKDSPLPPPEMHAPSVAAAAQALAAQSVGMVDAAPQNYARFALRKTFKAHRAAISSLALHPTRPLLATASDDGSWKLFSIPKGELLMSGEGHKDWLAGIDFHPHGGALLATASGDKTLKLWDVAQARCSATFTEHAAAVWDVAFHSGGDLFASASMDHTAKLWDLASNRCRQTFRGHVDSVNSVGWQPHGSGVLVTASGDKTVSLWDSRTGLCVQTLYGHANAVSSASFSAQGDAIVSADADGVVKLWDVRLLGERAHLRSLGGQAVNDARFSPGAGGVVALASDDHTVKLFSSADAKHLADLQGHEDAVQAVLFDPQGQFIVSAAADHTFRIWS